MTPKLIVINGPLGSGKSSLAKRYAEDHPLTLCLDIDDVWAMISHWRQEKDQSAVLAKDIAISMGRTVLNSGHDVVIPQILQTSELADRFKALASECGANYFEVLLDIDKEESIKRFKERNYRNGNPSGFREGGIIATSGREDKLSKMHDAMMSVANNRSIIRISPVYDDVDGTYSQLLTLLT